MTLAIDTFKNADLSAGWRPGNNPGGQTLFKALGHPASVGAARRLIERLAAAGPLAVFDPASSIGNFSAFYDLSACAINAYFVQRIEDLGRAYRGQQAAPVSQIGALKAKTLFVLAFDWETQFAPLHHLIPAGVEVITLDAMRLPDDMLTDTRRYLNPLNFATNYALLRDVTAPGAGPLHTRITTANYWGLHGAAQAEMYLHLFDAAGATLATWREGLGRPGALFAIDSRAVRERFGLGDFCGSLFMHALGIAGHDIVKYALDTYGAGGRALSCNHDANAWPADFYAGLPAPGKGETVTLFIQNSHPAPIPAGAVSINRMGADQGGVLQTEIAPFATYPLDVAELVPGAKWPEQLEIHAGRHFVRPRYEAVIGQGDRARRRIAHANVERADLAPDPFIPKLGPLMGKGYIMPLPVPPLAEFSTHALPTPMARSQQELPLKAELIDAGGEIKASRYLGRIGRGESLCLSIDQWLEEEQISLPAGHGHLELLYDFRDGGGADGWLHALGRFEQRQSGHIAETIFGAHIFNTAAIYKDEPQSYNNRPPGLTTRIFLRLADGQVTGRAVDTLCHLIYPASMPWHASSRTTLILHNREGRPLAEETLCIPCGGSRFWTYHEIFDAATRQKAGAGAYIIIRDRTCRLFGYHGLLNGAESFCLDHMFGF